MQTKGWEFLYIKACMLLLKTGSICLVNFDFAAIFFQFIFHAVINKKRKT